MDCFGVTPGKNELLIINTSYFDFYTCSIPTYADSININISRFDCLFFKFQFQIHTLNKVFTHLVAFNTYKQGCST